MGFQAVISTIASLVAIVGGVLGIISALSKEPVFTRLWQHQPRIKSQPSLQPLPSLSTPIERVVPSTHAVDQSRQILPPSRVKPGIVYGLVSGVLVLLILLGTQEAHPYLTISALVILSIFDGLLPSRRSGSVISAGIAGGILGIFLILDDVFYAIVTHQVWSTGDLVLGFAIFSVPSFIVSTLFGLLGRYLYKRLQVPAIKLASGTGAQQLQQAPQHARQVTVQGICPNCGKSNLPGAKFCNQCGTKL